MSYGKPFNQREQDPASWYFSLAVVLLLVAIGSAIAGGSWWAIAAISGAAGAYCYWKSRRAD